MEQRGDHSTSRQVPLSCKSTMANNQRVHTRKKDHKNRNGPSLSEWTFYGTVWTSILQSSYKNCFSFCYSYPLTSSLLLFSHPHSLCMPLAEDGDDRTQWLFNRFVLGSTMGGGIVVNIITYRSLPCQTGPITHGSQPPNPLPTLHMHPFLIPAWQRLSTPFDSVQAFNLQVFCFFLVFFGTDIGLMHQPKRLLIK